MVETDECTIIGQINAERFVDYNNAIPRNNSLRTGISIPEWRNELKSSVIFANQVTNCVRHVFADKKLELQSENTDWGNESVQCLPIDNNVDLTIGFNGKFLDGLLQNLTGNAQLEMQAANRAVLIYPEPSAHENCNAAYDAGNA